MTDEKDIPDAVVKKVRESDSGIRVADAIIVAEDIVRAAAGPDRITCPCCGMPDATTPERVVAYIHMVLFGTEVTKNPR